MRQRGFLGIKLEKKYAIKSAWRLGKEFPQHSVCFVRPSSHEDLSELFFQRRKTIFLDIKMFVLLKWRQMSELVDKCACKHLPFVLILYFSSFQTSWFLVRLHPYLFNVSYHLPRERHLWSITQPGFYHHPSIHSFGNKHSANARCYCVSKLC